MPPSPFDSCTVTVIFIPAGPIPSVSPVYPMGGTLAYETTAQRWIAATVAGLLRLLYPAPLMAPMPPTGLPDVLRRGYLVYVNCP